MRVDEAGTCAGLADCTRPWWALAFLDLSSLCLLYRPLPLLFCWLGAFRLPWLPDGLPYICAMKLTHVAIDMHLFANSHSNTDTINSLMARTDIAMIVRCFALCFEISLSLAIQPCGIEHNALCLCVG